MKTSFLLLVSLFILMPVGMSAVTLTQTTYPGPSQTIIRSQFTMVNVTLAGADPLYDYTIYGTIGANVTDLLPMSIVGEYFERDVTGDGTYSFVVHDEQYPFSRLAYTIRFYAHAYHPSNHTYVGGNVSTLVNTVSIDGVDSTGITTRLSFTGHTPSTLDLDAGSRVLTDGTTVNITSVSYGVGGCTAGSFTVYVFITDTAYPRELIAYKTVPVSYQTLSSSTLWQTYYYNVSAIVAECGNINFQRNHSYFIYYGVPMTGLLSSYGVDTDASCNVKSFSTSSLSSTGTLADDQSLTNDFVGAVVYFDCPWVSSAGFSTSFTPGTLGNWVRDYGDLIGLPWFYLLIAFLIIGIFTAVPFSFSIRYDFDLPNFVYGVFISIAVVINWGINLMDTWMMAFYFILLAFIIVTRFKDAIFSETKPRSYTERLNKLSFKRLLATPLSSPVAAGIAKDEGVKKPKTRPLRPSHPPPRELTTEELVEAMETGPIVTSSNGKTTKVEVRPTKYDLAEARRLLNDREKERKWVKDERTSFEKKEGLIRTSRTYKNGEGRKWEELGHIVPKSKKKVKK